MARITAQEAFDEACKEYDKAKAIVRELTAFAQVAQKSFSFEIAMREYDELLQAILLKVAMTDGYFVENEKQFVLNITDYGDILTTINRKLREFDDYSCDINWDMLTAIDNPDFVDNIIKISVTENIEDFIDAFAIIDALTPTNYIKVLKEATTKIVIALSVADGDDMESDDVHNEVFVGIKMFEVILEDRWQKIKEENNG